MKMSYVFVLLPLTTSLFLSCFDAWIYNLIDCYLLDCLSISALTKEQGQPFSFFCPWL